LKGSLKRIMGLVTFVLLSVGVNIGCDEVLGEDESVREFCEKMISCGWDPGMMESCVTEYAEALDYAGEVGCQEEINSYFYCVNTYSCKDLAESSACTQEYGDLSSCTGKID